MPISVTCERCGATMNAPDEFAGRRGRCKACGTTVRIPGERAPVAVAKPIAEPVPAVVSARPKPPAFDDVSDAYAPVPSPTAASDRTACEYCGEEILATAKKCKHCGEFLDAKLRKQAAKEAARAAAKAPPAAPVQQVVVHNQAIAGAYYPGPRWSPGVAALLSFLLPGAGQVYKGQVFNGIIWFIAVIAGYCAVIVPGLILHLLCVAGAASGDPRR